MEAGIILGGGLGKRFGGDMPKQFLELAGKKIIQHSIEKFADAVDIIVLVVHNDWLDFAKEHLDYPILFTVGGDTRQMSVYNGLILLKDFNIDVVAIHDGARPMFSIDLLKSCLKSAHQNSSGIAAIPATDTLVEVEANNKIINFLDRSKIYNIQTPQAYDYKMIMQAHQTALDKKQSDFTDDSNVFAWCGNTPFVVEGESGNIKITHLEDIAICEAMLQR